MAIIERKKQTFPVRRDLRSYLDRHRRAIRLPIQFEFLSRFDQTIPLYNKRGDDTLWQTVIYPANEREDIHRALVQIYATLKMFGRSEPMEHLCTDRIDICTWGNTRPLRVRILNTLNENFDYFYIKKADASRIYGLELEHLLSPNRIHFLVDGDTVVEEHIPGIPGDAFIKRWISDSHLDEIRLAKEFVKFNLRCFVRLLGDMHAGNYVVDITPDFDETHYRLRSIDFDQQSYEGRKSVYLPQFFKQNNPIVFLGMRCMTHETYQQYRQEELTLIASRVHAERSRLLDLLATMADDPIAPRDNVVQLRGELAEHYRDASFERCNSMGELVRTSLEMLPRLR